MKLRSLFTTLAIGAAASLTSAPVLAQTSCDAYICLAGMSGDGTPGGVTCQAQTQPFFSIVIYDEEGIDFPATALQRQIYLTTCPGATTGTNMGILEAIIAEWGMVIY